MSSALPPPVLVFQVGPRLFAAQAAEVERIGPALAGAPDVVGASCLGEPFTARRELVVRGAGAALAVDLVLGLRQPGAADLCPLPPFAAACLASRAVRGLVLLDGAPTPLVDLPTLLQEALLRAAAPSPGDMHHA
ncbi:chemotaxis protein CheW [Anaeromyxobacter diazotrophicus]|uniref:Chemotaxis signal transduction protein n=1 Tax=Anaeromyxobacter diazotrophicus TaxID=2590199 RepID=A0A7I9VHR3_9BACT|nr:chemotaxis protein CheW [Anaeromyxobacter diazotrophicus]GEJ55678.1 hypothetical protein AMYX_04190 [Anaeromyxobacter diazotrophicus]